MIPGAASVPAVPGVPGVPPPPPSPHSPAEIPGTASVAAARGQKVTVVVPARDERPTIGAAVHELKAALKDGLLEGEVVVVDDGSTDGTGDAARIHGARVITHPRPRGYGACVRAGVEAAANDVIAVIDADGTYPLREVPRLVGHIGTHLMVVGVRPGGDDGSVLARRLARRALGRLASFLADRDIPDATSGMRVFRREAFRAYGHLLPRRQGLTTFLTLALLADERAVAFVPIHSSPHASARKRRPLRDYADLAAVGLRAAFLFGPLKVCTGPGTLLFAAGVAKLIIDLAASEPGVATPAAVGLLLAGLVVLVAGFVADVAAAAARAPRR